MTAGETTIVTASWCHYGGMCLCVGMCSVQVPEEARQKCSDTLLCLLTVASVSSSHLECSLSLTPAASHCPSLSKASVSAETTFASS